MNKHNKVCFEDLIWWINFIAEKAKIPFTSKFIPGTKYGDPHLEIQYGSRNWIEAYIYEKEIFNEISKKKKCKQNVIGAYACIYHPGCWNPRTGGDPPDVSKVELGEYFSPIRATEEIAIKVIQYIIDEIIIDQLMAFNFEEEGGEAK